MIIISVKVAAQTLVLDVSDMVHYRDLNGESNPALSKLIQFYCAYKARREENTFNEKANIKSFMTPTWCYLSIKFSEKLLRIQLRSRIIFFISSKARADSLIPLRVIAGVWGGIIKFSLIANFVIRIIILLTKKKEKRKVVIYFICSICCRSSVRRH